MASCVKRGRRERREPGFYRQVEDGVRIKAEKIRPSHKEKVDTKKMYQIEIVDRDKENNMVKVHYVGYSEDWDEWKSCHEFSVGRMEHRFQPDNFSFSDRSSTFFSHLRRKIKFALFSSKREDPDVRIEEPTDIDIYEQLLKSQGVAKTIRGRVVNSVPDNSLLDDLLSPRWSERILNKNGDFSFAVKETVQYWLHEKAPINEFVYIGNTLVESHLENDIVLVFTFMRGDGVAQEYHQGRWK